MYMALNIILLVCGFLFTKLYTKSETAPKSTAIFILIDGVLGFIFTAALSKLNFSVYDVVFGALIGALACFNLTAQLKAYKYGDLSVYTLFLMSGGMILPVLYGKIFLSEGFPVVYYFTLPLIVACMFLSIPPQKFKKSIAYYLICIAVFASNGLMSVLSKIYSTYYGNEYAMLCGKYVFEVVFALILTFVVRKSCVFQANPDGTHLKNLKTVLNEECYAVTAVETESTAATDASGKESAIAKKSNPARTKISLLNKKSSLIYAILTFVFSGLAYFLQLLVLNNTDAVLFFPIQTCGTILLTFIVGKLVLKERKEKREIVFSIGILVAFVLTIAFI